MSETPDQGSTRRRWITLAEVVAVAGVVIAALTLYTGWSDRRADEADRVAAQADDAREKARVALVATVGDGGRTLALRDARHDLTDLLVTFPTALAIARQSPAETTIEAGWFDGAILKLTDGGPDERTGRLPVLLAVRYVQGDQTRTASGIYDVIWRTHGRMLRGRILTLEGLKLRRRGGTAASLDAAWARERPAPRS